MTRPAVQLEIRTRDQRLVAKISLRCDMTVAELKQQVQHLEPHLVPSRQYFTLGSGRSRVPLKDDSATLESYGIDEYNEEPVYLKDLGPQVPWTTVFVVEYAGPLLIHPLVYFFPSLFYSDPIISRSLAQQLALALVMIHYTKRELETLFVHRFSNGTMPLRNLFKNSFHYWILGGYFLAYPIYHPHYLPMVSDRTALLCAALFVVFMGSNLVCHLILARLRPLGSRVRRIPRGFAFELVSCPNYTFEILSWLSFALLTASAASYLFLAVSAVQMGIWANAKHRSYRRQFDGKEGRPLYPRGRAALLPLLF